MIYVLLVSDYVSEVTDIYYIVLVSVNEVTMIYVLLVSDYVNEITAVCRAGQ